MIEKVKKRNGKVEKFSHQKLINSIDLAMHISGRQNKDLSHKVAHDTTKILEGKRKQTVTSEDIRKSVCTALKKDKHHDVCEFFSLVWLHSKPTKIRHVVKRDGRKERFSSEKLFKSVQKSFRHSGINDQRELLKTTQQILETLRRQYANKEVHSENIKLATEYVLTKRAPKAARHYVLYRYV